ncbi:barstar family protein [Streptomyces sp. NPDC002306]
MRSEEYAVWGRDFPVRYLLVKDDLDDKEPAVPWGRCAEVEGLFMDPPPLPREVLTLRGCPRESLLAQAVTRTAEPVRLLGDGTISIEPTDPSNEGPFPFWSWDLENTAVLAHWPTPGEPGRVDVVLGAGVAEDDHWDSKRLPVNSRFDLWLPTLLETGPSGSCRSIDGLFSPRPRQPSQPVHLVGCEPAEPLLDLLCRPLPRNASPIALWCLDRQGRTMDTHRLELRTVEARPSVLGGTLIDVTLTDPGDDRHTLAARPILEIWFDGVPTQPNKWAQFDTSGRSEWLDLTRVGPYGPDGLSGGTYRLDGQHVTDRTSLLLALGEALLGPGAHYGRSLDSVKDYLGGGPSVVPPFTLVWHHADAARHALAEHILDHQDGLSYFEATVNLLREYGVTVVLE